MAITRTPGIVSALVLTLASALARADVASTSADSGSLTAAPGVPGPAAGQQGPRGPDVARLLLRASLAEIEKTSSLATAAQNIRETLAAAEQTGHEARAALDQAIAPQLRNGAIDTSSLASLITAAEEAQQAARVALVQAVDDARSLLTDEQRASVVASVEAQLTPDSGPGGQGSGGPPGGQGAGGPPAGPPPGGSDVGAPPSAPDATSTSATTTSTGSTTQVSSDASTERLARDPLLAGIDLTDAQKQALIALGYLGSDSTHGGSMQGPPPGPPPGATTASTSTTSTTTTTDQTVSGPGMPGSGLLDAFASSATELPLPSAPTTGSTSPTAERVRKLALLAEVLDTAQRSTLAARLT